MALKMAEKYKGFIINADSLQFFKDLKIGTAFPSQDDLNRAPHLLYGICGLGEEFTAGDFVKTYNQLEDELILKDQSHHQLIADQTKVTPLILVGGSGFYIRALETGMFNLSRSPKAEKDLEFRQWSKSKKIEFLNLIDAKHLQKIGENDEYRLDRALEIYFTEGKSVSELQQEMELALQAKIESDEPPFALKMGVYVERDELLKNITVRTQRMLDQGLIDEVKTILKQVEPTWKPLQSVGYKETQQFIHQQGITTIDELKSEIIKNTMNLAKKQMTWFRADKDVVWFHAHNDFTKAMLWFEEVLLKFEN